MLSPSCSRSSLELRQDLRLHGHVERGGGLVGEQDLRAQRERHRDHHALAHSAGELVRVGARALTRPGDADALHQLAGPQQRLRLGDEGLVGPDLLGDLLAHAVDRVQRGLGVLEDHRKLGPPHAPQLRLGRSDQIATIK